MFLAITIITVVLVLLFARSAIPKIRRRPAVATTATHLDVPVGLMHAVGVLEALGAVGLALGLAYTPLGVAAAAGLFLLMIAATIAHLRVRDPIKIAIAPVVIAVLPGVLLLLHLAHG